MKTTTFNFTEIDLITKLLKCTNKIFNNEPINNIEHKLIIDVFDSGKTGINTKICSYSKIIAIDFKNVNTKLKENNKVGFDNERGFYDILKTEKFWDTAKIYVAEKKKYEIDENDIIEIISGLGLIVMSRKFGL